MFKGGLQSSGPPASVHAMEGAATVTGPAAQDAENLSAKPYLEVHGYFYNP